MTIKNRMKMLWYGTLFVIFTTISISYFLEAAKVVKAVGEVTTIYTLGLPWLLALIFFVLRRWQYKEMVITQNGVVKKPRIKRYM